MHQFLMTILVGVCVSFFTCLLLMMLILYSYRGLSKFKLKLGFSFLCNLSRMYFRTFMYSFAFVTDCQNEKIIWAVYLYVAKFESK